MTTMEELSVVEVGRGAVAVVDAADAPLLVGKRWFARWLDGRPVTISAFFGGKSVTLARFILNAPAGMWVDHINGDVLDNRRANLRLCTPAQNAANRKRRKETGLKAPYKGVYPYRGRFYARINANGRSFSLGGYATPEAAARAYDAAARHHFGAFARCNFSEEGVAA